VRQFLAALILSLMAFSVATAQAPSPNSATPGDEDMPVLIKHLPNWESVQKQSKYIVTIEDLKNVLANQPVLDSVSFEGGTEAVTANYAQGQLLIVEFSTPQFSVENDQRIAAKIQELKTNSQPVPTAYRRVGNYSVFVFNGRDEGSANQLIDQVHYQKVVQWLGEDPHLYERLQRYFTQTTAGVLVAVLKSSGLSLLACLAIGGIFGYLLFRQRRARASELYSDAGGSVRLNLDELTHDTDTSRLLDSPKR
jgi:hypothetical protein